MNKVLAELLTRRPPPKCERCKGSGVITVSHPRLWMPEVCWCGRCNGTGKEPTHG